jgi:type IX secretion system PorP/SprF family membrane protein
MKTYLYILLIILSAEFACAQQDGAYSQYMFNGLILNPAYAGSKPYMSSAALYRRQWVDFPGSPVTQTLYLHGPLPSRKVGVGFSLVNDHIGVTNRTDLNGSYSYHMQVGPGFLAMGLQGGFSYYNSKLSDLNIWDNTDEVFAYDRKRAVLPNFGTGLYYYATKFYLGLSVPHMLNNSTDGAFMVRADHKIRHYYLSSGYVIILNRDVKVKPSVLIKYVESAPVQTDFNINVLLQNIFWIGGSYRTGDAFVGIFEFQLTNRLRIGYSYDATLSSMKTYSGGSHEIMIGYDFGYDILKMKTQRYF